MVFHSFTYLIFLVVVATLTYICNQQCAYRWRNLLLLAASYIFYAWLHPWFVLLLLYVSGVAYAGGRGISLAQAKGKTGKRESTITIVAIIICLIFFKYAYIANASIFLPIGLSFFSFQALTYTIDIYRKNIKTDDLLSVSLFIAFFPTLLCGPIERARNILPQIKGRLAMSYEGLREGAQRFIWGVLKKIVVADRLGLFVDEIYYQPEAHSGSTLLLAAIFYSFQIYADFSGYADMAIGSARILGIRLTENFKLPYFAKSFRDFWHRWHISLTSWFTEYVYFPLGGNRVGQARWILNISAVFILSGIWHGATFSFIVWGAMHAFLYLAEHYSGIKHPNWLYHSYVFLMVTAAWIFFRITDISQAIHVVTTICTDCFSTIYLGSSSFSTILTIALLFAFVIREWLYSKGRNYATNPIECIFLLLAICLFGVKSTQFVYFQF